MPEKLSTKVVYDPNSEKYVGVFGNHALRLWSEDTRDIAKCKKLKFQKSIAHLVYTEQEAIVLYSDGSCQSLSQALNTRKDQNEHTAAQLALAASVTLSKPTVHTISTGEQVLTYFEEKNANGQLFLTRINLTTSSRRIFEINREGVRLTGYAVIEGDSWPQLMTICKPTFKNSMFSF